MESLSIQGDNKMNYELVQKIDGIVETLNDLRGHL
jgi:hypothetical protein